MPAGGTRTVVAASSPEATQRATALSRRAVTAVRRIPESGGMMGDVVVAAGEPAARR